MLVNIVILLLSSRSMNALNINLSLTYKVLTASQLNYLHNLISVLLVYTENPLLIYYPCLCSTIHIFLITSYSLLVSMCVILCLESVSCFILSISYSAPFPNSPHFAYIPSHISLSSLSLSITPSVFYSQLKNVFHKSCPPLSARPRNRSSRSIESIV